MEQKEIEDFVGIVSELKEAFKRRYENGEVSYQEYEKWTDAESLKEIVEGAKKRRENGGKGI